MRQYVAAVRTAGQNDLSLDGESLKGWSTWAINLADRLDPLRAERLSEKFRPGDNEKAEVPATK
jgi:hypothetical protein